MTKRGLGAAVAAVVLALAVGGCGGMMSGDAMMQKDMKGDAGMTKGDKPMMDTDKGMMEKKP